MYRYAILTSIAHVRRTYAACVYTDDCATSGEQTRTNIVCRAGAMQEEQETQACSAIRMGSFWTNRIGPAPLLRCIEVGEQMLTNSVCRDGVAVNEPVFGHEQDTDGIIVEQPEFDVHMLTIASSWANRYGPTQSS